MSRDGTLVVRPDSGEPAAVVLDVVRRLEAAFGAARNEKGYVVLDPHVRVIQGDGVDLDVIEAVYGELERHGYSADNVNFGMGGALLQRIDRDTQRFAIKASYVEVGGAGYGIAKSPVDAAWKASRAGRQSRTAMHTVFVNGMLQNETTFTAVRELAAEGL
jgi:nicotinamide phosphoribosyltransferase